MCGRFYADENMIKEIWEVVRDVDRKLHLPTVGEIRPSDASIVIRGDRAGLEAEVMRWGFIPLAGSGLIINARAESVADKPTFRDSIRQRRCVIPANWFYEWNRNKERATFRRLDSAVLYMAGLYQRHENCDRFTILTTAANNSMKPVHDRMPILLEKHEIGNWVSDERYVKHILDRVPMELVRAQEYEQQTFFF